MGGRWRSTRAEREAVHKVCCFPCCLPSQLPPAPHASLLPAAALTRPLCRVCQPGWVGALQPGQRLVHCAKKLLRDTNVLQGC